MFVRVYHYAYVCIIHNRLCSIEIEPPSSIQLPHSLPIISGVEYIVFRFISSIIIAFFVLLDMTCNMLCFFISFTSAASRILHIHLCLFHFRHFFFLYFCLNNLVLMVVDQDI
ncbi:hypothetical protein HanXRQr2_Chr15g0689151 [Helianthus annuus]|uniref:Uncharacterized protein n=1 Tax=Helianthus annuus TaxID=4232 RepID=A0A9K3E0W4_HELAN|nr:hypothetical protein HanXRQr2_Chr15g0689151 [Helianthus annuus]